MSDIVQQIDASASQVFTVRVSIFLPVGPQYIVLVEYAHHHFIIVYISRLISLSGELWALGTVSIAKSSQVYDCFLTLDDEVFGLFTLTDVAFKLTSQIRLIWSEGWAFKLLVYVLNRYTPLLTSIMGIYGTFQPYMFIMSKFSTMYFFIAMVILQDIKVRNSHSLVISSNTFQLCGMALRLCTGWFTMCRYVGCIQPYVTVTRICCIRRFNCRR